MTEAVTPPNPAGAAKDSANGRNSKPDPTLLTIDALRREIAMLENLTNTRAEGLESLIDERFKRVDSLMERAEDLRREQKSDTARAVAASLESQKEATAKMERSISDQIASLRNNFETEITSIRGSVNDMKERMTIIESVKAGAVEQKTETRTATAGVYAAIGIGITILLFLFTVAAFFAGGGLG